MKFTLNNQLILEDFAIDTGQLIQQKLTLKNPKFYEAQKMGRYTRGIEPVLFFFEADDNRLSCPRGAATQIYKICQDQGETIDFFDDRHTLKPVDFIDRKSVV